MLRKVSACCRLSVFLFCCDWQINSFQKIHYQLPDYIQILCAVVLPYPAIILVKNRVQNPVQVVFNSPVSTHGFCGKLYVLKARDKISLFPGLAVFCRPAAPNHSDCTKIFPVVLLFEPFEVRTEKIPLYSILPWSFSIPHERL